MIFADVMVRFSTVDVVVHDKLPCGAAGLKVQFRFLDSAWHDLKKIAVFRNKSQIFDVAIVDNCATIPQELLTKVLDVIEVGVYGTNADQVLAIPTLWGNLGRIESAANPSGDPAMDPTLPYWALLQEQVDMLENTILGNDDLESVRVSALRTSGGKMSGDIEMCGNTITGLRTPANDTDAATKGYVQSAAAPAGYGLGENSGRQPYTADLNEITTIGFWAMPGGNAVNYPDKISYSGYGSLLVERRTDKITQTVKFNGYIAVRSSGDNGVSWEDWKYVNPPMELGVEYRTTERNGGSAVYAKRVAYKLGAINASNAVVNSLVPHGISNLGYLVRTHCAKDSYVLPYLKDDGGFTSIASVDSANITVRAYKATWAEATWFFDLYYVKY